MVGIADDGLGGLERECSFWELVGCCWGWGWSWAFGRYEDLETGVRIRLTNF